MNGISLAELLEQIEDLPYGPERVTLAEEAVRQADLHGDGEAGYEARMALVEAAIMSGQSEKAFVPFAWCQDHAVHFPDDVDFYLLIWAHKWILGAALDFPQIPLQRIQELHKSYAEHAKKLGGGSASTPYMWLSVAMHIGDRDEAKRAFKAWSYAQNDILSDCSACEAHQEASYHAFMGDHEACIKQSLHIINSKMTCGEIPHLVYGTMLHSMLQLGREEEAKTYAAIGREMVSGHPDFLSTQAEHLEFLAKIHDESAISWYERHLPLCEGSKECHSQMKFHAAAACLFAELQKDGRNEISIGHVMYNLSERHDHHWQQAQSLAKQFDERNGTSHQMDDLMASLA